MVNISEIILDNDWPLSQKRPHLYQKSQVRDKQGQSPQETQRGILEIILVSGKIQFSQIFRKIAKQE